jgi:hypothetical protein
MLEQRTCVTALSKRIDRGRIGDPERERRQCDDEPRCLSLTTRQSLELDLRTFACEEEPEASILGVIRVLDLIHVFDGSADGRGFHSGDFRWESAGLLAFGRMSGITNAGTHHEPVMECQECRSPGFLQGQLCGSIAWAQDTSLRGAHLFANYVLRARDIAGDGIPKQEDILGTLEGVLVRGCGCCG